MPFDLRSIRVLVYDKDHPDWGNKLRLSLTKAIKEVLQNPTSAIPTTFKVAVKPIVPEEAETALRLETLEAMVHRLADGLDANSFGTYVDHVDPKSALRVQPRLKPGQNVFHAKFGRGKVISVEDSGMRTRAQINFNEHGVKWMATHVAKLNVLPD